MKRNFKLVSLLTIFTVVLNILSVLVLMRPAMAASVLDPITDTMSSLLVTTGSTHTIGFTTSTDNTTTFVVTFAPEFVNNAGAATVSGGTCVVVELVVTCTTTTNWFLYTPITDLVVTGMSNPNTAGSYSIGIVNGAGTGSINKGIVDSSMDVEVNGYINSSLSFDIDTTTASDNQECSPTTCLAYEGYIGDALDAYTVDLGNLTTGAINKSDTLSVLHSDGGYGKINSIYFDLSTNAIDGAIVTVISANKALDSDDDTIAATTTLSVGAEGYGINVSSPGSTTADCSGATYCDLSGGAVDLFHTIAPVEGARVIAAVAAAVSPLTNPGTYTDTLTFVATATF